MAGLDLEKIFLFTVSLKVTLIFLPADFALIKEEKKTNLNLLLCLTKRIVLVEGRRELS